MSNQAQPSKTAPDRDKPSSLQAVGQMEHAALARTWWMNLYPDGQCTGTLFGTRESALDACTYTGEIPDAMQAEVRIVLAKPS
jgi:hypothetical protein